MTIADSSETSCNDTMSANTLVLDSPTSFTLQPGESVLTPGNTADIELRIPATISGPKRTESAKGRLWVTDQRVIFASDPSSSGPSKSYDAPPELQSLVIPYSILLSSAFNLPTFSPNHIIIHFLPDPLHPAPNLPSPGRGGKLEVKIVVGEGAGHAVWKRIEGERGRAVERRNQEEELPVYTAQSNLTVQQGAPPPA